MNPKVTNPGGAAPVRGAGEPSHTADEAARHATRSTSASRATEAMAALHGARGLQTLPTPSGSAFTVYADPSGRLMHDLPVDRWRAGDAWASQSDFAESGMEWNPNTDVGLLRRTWEGHPAGSLVIAGMWACPKGLEAPERRCEALAIRARRAGDAWLEPGPGPKTTDKSVSLKSPLPDLLDKVTGRISPDYQTKESFHREGQRVLRALAKAMGLIKGTFEVRSNKGGNAVAGEITLHAPKVYIQILGDHHSPDGKSVLFRACKGPKDYTGGRNQFASVHDLLNITEFAIRMNNVQDR